jgi:hypothetical protein
MCTVALAPRLLGRSASESGRLRHGDGGHKGGDRRRRVLVLPSMKRLAVSTRAAISPLDLRSVQFMVG